MKLLTRDREFYTTLLRLASVIILQNVVAYSVNMADNLMLGVYSQEALSGAAAVNQLQFLVQQSAIAAGDSMVALNAQYWGQRRIAPMRRLTALALLAAALLGGAVFFATSAFPRAILTLFTTDEAIIAQGMAYLELIRFTYPLYIFSSVLMSALRSVETVGISFWVSLASLVVDVAINDTLIFGKRGFPEMGVRGAAVGTLAARCLELAIILGYVLFADKRLRLFSENPFRGCASYLRDYWRMLWPAFTSQMLWALATPIQTGVLGHLSSDAIAANSVSTTLFQYLKMIVSGEASASAVLMGRTIGRGEMEKVRDYSRTLQVIFLLVGLVLGTVLFWVRIPLLSVYALNDNARRMADQIMMLLSLVFMGMAYQMPVTSVVGIGGGDNRFTLRMNLISSWGIVMPLSFAAAFWWKLPVVVVVLCLNLDQIFKCIPTFLRINSYRWVHRLTRENGA